MQVSWYMPNNNYLYFKCIVTNWTDLLCIQTMTSYVLTLDREKMSNSTFKYQTKIVNFYLKIYLNTVNRDDTM